MKRIEFEEEHLKLEEHHQAKPVPSSDAELSNSNCPLLDLRSEAQLYCSWLPIDFVFKGPCLSYGLNNEMSISDVHSRPQQGKHRKDACSWNSCRSGKKAYIVEPGKSLVNLSPRKKFKVQSTKLIEFSLVDLYNRTMHPYLM